MSSKETGTQRSYFNINNYVAPDDFWAKSGFLTSTPIEHIRKNTIDPDKANKTPPLNAQMTPSGEVVPQLESLSDPASTNVTIGGASAFSRFSMVPRPKPVIPRHDDGSYVWHKPPQLFQPTISVPSVVVVPPPPPQCEVMQEPKKTQDVGDYLNVSQTLPSVGKINQINPILEKQTNCVNNLVNAHSVGRIPQPQPIDLSKNYQIDDIPVEEPYDPLTFLRNFYHFNTQSQHSLNASQVPSKYLHYASQQLTNKALMKQKGNKRVRGGCKSPQQRLNFDPIITQCYKALTILKELPYLSTIPEQTKNDIFEHIIIPLKFPVLHQRIGITSPPIVILHADEMSNINDILEQLARDLKINTQQLSLHSVLSQNHDSPQRNIGSQSNTSMLHPLSLAVQNCIDKGPSILHLTDIDLITSLLNPVHITNPNDSDTNGENSSIMGQVPSNGQALGLLGLLKFEIDRINKIMKYKQVQYQQYMTYQSVQYNQRCRNWKSLIGGTTGNTPDKETKVKLGSLNEQSVFTSPTLTQRGPQSITPLVTVTTSVSVACDKINESTAAKEPISTSNEPLTTRLIPTRACPIPYQQITGNGQDNIPKPSIVDVMNANNGGKRNVQPVGDFWTSFLNPGVAVNNNKDVKDVIIDMEENVGNVTTDKGLKTLPQHNQSQPIKSEEKDILSRPSATIHPDTLKLSKQLEKSRLDTLARYDAYDDIDIKNKNQMNAVTNQNAMDNNGSNVSSGVVSNQNYIASASTPVTPQQGRSLGGISAASNTDRKNRFNLLGALKPTPKRPEQSSENYVELNSPQILSPNNTISVNTNPASPISPLSYFPSLGSPNQIVDPVPLLYSLDGNKPITGMFFDDVQFQQPAQYYPSITKRPYPSPIIIVLSTSSCHDGIIEPEMGLGREINSGKVNSDDSHGLPNLYKNKNSVRVMPSSLPLLPKIITSLYPKPRIVTVPLPNTTTLEYIVRVNLGKLLLHPSLLTVIQPNAESNVVTNGIGFSSIGDYSRLGSVQTTNSTVTEEKNKKTEPNLIVEINQEVLSFLVSQLIGFDTKSIQWMCSEAGRVAIHRAITVSAGDAQEDWDIVDNDDIHTKRINQHLGDNSCIFPQNVKVGDDEKKSSVLDIFLSSKAVQQSRDVALLPLLEEFYTFIDQNISNHVTELSKRIGTKGNHRFFSLNVTDQNKDNSELIINWLHQLYFSNFNFDSVGNAEKSNQPNLIEKSARFITQTLPVIIASLSVTMDDLLNSIVETRKVFGINKVVAFRHGDSAVSKIIDGKDNQNKNPNNGQEYNNAQNILSNNPNNKPQLMNFTITTIQYSDLGSAKNITNQIDTISQNDDLLVEKNNISDKDTFLPNITGHSQAKKLIYQSTILPLQFPTLFQHFNIPSNVGILLYGPPGCGKTMIAKDFAQHELFSFFSASCSDLLSAYFGESEKKLKEYFKKAMQSSPSVLFFDEIDAVAKHRGGNGGESNETTDSSAINRFISQFLTLFDNLQTNRNQLLTTTKRNKTNSKPDDGLTLNDIMNKPVAKQDQIVIFGATNLPSLIDGALTRPGRFQYHIYIGLPDFIARLELITKALRVVIVKTEHYTASALPNSQQLTQTTYNIRTLSDSLCDDTITVDLLIDMAEKLIGATFADLDSLISNAKDRAIRRTIAMVQKEKKNINNTNKGFYNIKSKQEKMIGGIIYDAQNSSQNSSQISKVCKRDLDYIMKIRSEQQSSVNRALLPMLKSMIEYKYQSNTIDDGFNQQVRNINQKNNSNHFYQNNFVPRNGSAEPVDPLLYPFRDFQSDELDNEEFDNDEFAEMNVAEMGVAESDKNNNTKGGNQYKNKKQFSLLSRLFFSTSHDLYTFSTTYHSSNELQSTGGNVYIDCSDQYNDETELILLFQHSLLYSPFHLHNQAKVLMQRFILELKKNKILAEGKNTTSNDNSAMNDDVNSDNNDNDNDNDDVFMQEEIKLYQNEIMEKVNYIQKKAIPILLQQEFFASVIEYKQALAIPNVEYINIPHLLQVLYKWDILKHTNDGENITNTDDKTNVLEKNDESISTPPPTVDQEETDHPVQPKTEFDLQKLLQMVKQPPGVSQSASTHRFEHPLMKIKYLIDIDRYNVYGDGKL